VFTGSIYVYVVSHQSEGDVVEKFLFDGSKTLRHEKTIANESDFIQ